MENKKLLKTKKFKTSKGITLIALIITIIVLLILAGVSIATLSGDNGVLTKASDSKIVNDIGALKDEIVLKASEAMSDYYEKIYVSNTGESAYNRANLVETIMKKIAKEYVGNEAGGTKEYGTYTVTISGTGAGATITIQSKTKSSLKTVGTMQDDGKIIWDDNYTSKTQGNPPAGDTIQAGETATGGNKKYIADGKTAVIPENFTVSSTESSINTGLVVTGPDGSEFVWIPIDKDTLNPIGATAVLENKEMAEQVDGKWRGILYNFTGSGTTITSSKKTYSTSSYREPGDVSADSSNGITETALQNEYNAIINSIKSNGGFYVGRYESSLDGNNKIQSKGGTNIKPTSANNTNTNKWYGLYAKQQTYAGNETGKTYTVTTDKVNSTMITGACYDAMLNWALNSGSDSAKVMASTNAPHNLSATVDCGSTTTDKINNIFDLEGNVREWTSEANSTDNRVGRGRSLLY